MLHLMAAGYNMMYSAKTPGQELIKIRHWPLFLNAFQLSVIVWDYLY